MANEFKHNTVGPSLSQSEWEDLGLHVFNSQNIGDILYASSTTQLSGLAIGATSAFLQVVAGVPSWVVSPVLSGTPGMISHDVSSDRISIFGGTTTAGFGAKITLTGKTYGLVGSFFLYTPDAALTADIARLTVTGGLATAIATWSDITQTGIVLSGVIASGAGLGLVSNVNNSYVILKGGNNAAGYGAFVAVTGKDNSGYFAVYTPDAAKTADVQRLAISGNAATVTATWASITQTGIVLTASEKIYPVSGVAGFSVVSTTLTLGSLGSIVLPQGNMSGAANDAARDALAGNVLGACAWDSADLSFWIRGAAGVWKHAHLA